MTDLNDDLLNYDIGDVIDDQVLIGADEDELLLSDEDLEKDVSKEERQKLKSEAEEWVKSQIKEKPHKSAEPQPQKIESDQNEQTSVQVTIESENSEKLEDAKQSIDESDEVRSSTAAFVQDTPSTTTQNELLVVAEVSSSSTKDVDMEQSSTVSNSTVISGTANESCASSGGIQSSQESASVTMSHGDISDPREDYEEEREERTNIKITSEREKFEQTTEHSPDKSQGRYVPPPKIISAPLIRGHPIRGPSPLFPRPPLRFANRGYISLLSPSHFSPLGGLAPVALSHNTTNPLIPGQTFLPPQQPSSIPFGPQPPSNTLQNPAHGPIPNPNLDPNNPEQRPRHPFGFRPGPMGGFRHPNPTSMFSQVPHDYNQNQGPVGFNHPFGGPRNMFRPEGALGNVPPGMRPGMRMQRPPLQALPHHGIPGQGNFVNAPPMQIRPQAVPGPQPPQAGQTQVTNNQPPANQLPVISNSGASIAPRKVLINPNFKGGVEAATSKFIQETQYMNAMNSPHASRVQSDEDLLRQQEEFINKNREHIEKRRHARESPVRRSRSRSPRSRSRSRSRSVSRERSYTPPKRHANGGPNNNRSDRFDRDRERDRERERERDRERDRDRDRPGNNDGNVRMGRPNSRDRDDRDRDRIRPLAGYNNRTGSGMGGGGGNRFRRGNSRDRDYENRNQGGGGGGNYGKRRRSKSPSPGGNRGGGGGNNAGNNRGRYKNDRDKPDVDEDEETRAYRLQIEKQKAMREQIMRDKEMKRRRAAEEKQYEEKRGGGSSGQQQQKDDQSQHQQQPQKFKEVVPERKMISLKKRPNAQNDNFSEDYTNTQRKSIPTAKILPEAKKTLAEHLSNNSSSSSGRDHSNSHSSNTAVIKPVLKKESSSLATVDAIRPQAQNYYQPPRRLSSRCEDEVQLDYDEDDLLLDEEDLLASEPESSPPRDAMVKQRAESHTPSPEPAPKALIRRPLHTRGSGSGGGGGTGSSSGGGGGTSKPSLSSANRRIVLKTSSNTVQSSSSSSGNRGNASASGNSSSSSRRVVLDRLEVRSSRQQSPGHGSGGTNSDAKRKPQRIILKHD